MRDHWHSVKIAEVSVEKQEYLKVGNAITVRASIELGDLKPSDVSVELCYGSLNAQGEIESPKVALMKSAEKKSGSRIQYAGTITMETSGRLGHTIRILPHNEDLDNPYKQGLIVWA